MSEVWNHFYMAPNGLSVNCNHCGKFMKRSDSSTKSMWGHLKAFHADLVGEETFRLKRTRRMRGSAGTGTKKSQEKKKAADSKKAQQKTAVQEQQQQESASSGSSSAGDDDEFSSGVSSRGPSPTEQQQQPKSGTQSPKLGGEEPEKPTAAAAALSIQSLLQLGVAELAKEEVKQEVVEKETEKEPIKETETPTQPYVKRKRQQQQSQQKSGDSQAQQPIVDQQPLADHPATILKQHVKEAASPSPQLQQPKKKSPSPPAVQMPAASIVSPNSQLADIPHSGPQSAFSKYSTAALLQGQEAGGKKSPAHGEEAPKQQRQSAALPLAATGGQMTTPSAARTNYGMEAMQGLNSQQLAMLGMTDQSLMAQLDTMNQLVQLQQQSEKMQQQPLNGQSGMTASQQPSLNDLLALYAASALQQQQQQDGLKAKAAGQQQQLAAQQAAAATAWLYNWEWMVAAQRMQQQQQQGNAGANYGILAGLPAAQLQQQQQPKGAQLNGQQAAALGLTGGFNGSLTNGTAVTQRTKSQQQQQQAADTMLARAAMSQLLIQAQAQQQQQQQTKQHSQPSSTPNVVPTAAKQPKTESSSQQSHQAQKRKSPSATATVPSSNNDDCAAASLLVLADTAASTAAVERRMRDQRESAENGGGSPAKQARREPTPQQAENEKALTESLVLYGMHRIAMDLQLSYSVHATRQGRAEYAFYCAAGAGNGTTSTQQMVTLTESADQILHLREIANGTVVTEERWPKSAEPCSLLHSLKDKCQRRLCSAQ